MQTLRATIGAAASLTLLLLGVNPAPARAADNGALLKPSSVFVQAAMGDQSAHTYVIGATRDWPWQHDFSFGTATGYFETSFGRWSAEHAPRGSSWMTQLGVTPVLRLYPVGAGTRWFTEIGVGANYILPIFNSGSKRFSTEFNFGDHIAVGHSWGNHSQHELVVRLQHFSNAGIAHPNPGENFGQLRYAYRLNH